MKIESDAVHIGVSVMSGLTAMMAAETGAAVNQSPEGTITALYLNNGEASRIIVAATVAMATYILLEIKKPKQK